MKHKHSATKKESESLARIPSTWNQRHNWGLFVFLLAIFAFWLNRLIAPEVDTVRAANEVIPQLFWSALLATLFLVWALLWHKRRLAELYGLKLAMDGRQDDVFNAIWMVACVLFMGAWALICVLNPVPTEQLPERVYTVENVSFPGKKARVRLTLEASAPVDYISLSMKFLPLKREAFQAQDKIYLNYTRGKLGFWHVAALHWQPKDSTRSIRLFPRPEKLPD